LPYGSSRNKVTLARAVPTVIKSSATSAIVHFHTAMSYGNN
jgi:hypothetical protein